MPGVLSNSESAFTNPASPQPMSSSTEPQSPAQLRFKIAFVTMESCWRLYFKAILTEHMQNRTIFKSVERKRQGWGQNRWPERISPKNSATF